MKKPSTIFFLITCALIFTVLAGALAMLLDGNFTPAIDVLYVCVAVAVSMGITLILAGTGR